MLEAQNILNQFGDSIGIGPIPLDEFGCAKLEFSETVEVNLELAAEDQLLHLYSIVGHLPAEGKESLYERLLSANHFGSQTSGHHLAIDLEENIVLLNRSFDESDLTFENFSHKLASFVQTVSYWTEQLAGASGEASNTQDTSGFFRV